MVFGWYMSDAAVREICSVSSWKVFTSSCTLHSSGLFCILCLCCVWLRALTGSVVVWLDRSRYSLLYGTSYRQRGGASLINTVQGHVWQVVVIAVTLDLPWWQAVVVCVCCKDMTQMQNSVNFGFSFVFYDNPVEILSFEYHVQTDAAIFWHEPEGRTSSTLPSGFY